VQSRSASWESKRNVLSITPTLCRPSGNMQSCHAMAASQLSALLRAPSSPIASMKLRVQPRTWLYISVGGTDALEWPVSASHSLGLRYTRSGAKSISNGWHQRQSVRRGQ